MRLDRARMASVPLHTSHVVAERRVCPPCLLTVASVNNVLSIRDHRGQRSYGFFYEHDPVALAEWDAWLDSRDAANEDAEGRLVGGSRHGLERRAA